MLNVVMTIDVENPQTDYRKGRVTNNLVNPLIGDEPYGVLKLAKIFDDYAVKGVFFVTTSEKNIFDEGFYKSLCIDLHSRGHEIGIHSHPEWMTKDDRIHMWQFSYEEQLSMLREMKQDIKQWIGEAPISHRAGAYGISYNTFKALEELNIKVDSSIFAEHKNCKVQLSYNNLIKINNLIEVPVTGFHKVKRLRIGLIKIPFFRAFVKTDIETCSFEELKWFVDYGVSSNLKIFNLFMHSYSLFSLKSLPKISRNGNEQKLSALIGYMEDHPGVKFTTLRDLSMSPDIEALSEPSVINREQVPVLYEDFSISQFLTKLNRKLKSISFSFFSS